MDKVFLYLLIPGNKGHYVLLFLGDKYRNQEIILDIVRDKIRFEHYSIKREKSYVGWIKHHIFYHNKKHPIEMEKPEIEQFITYITVERKVSPTTQNQDFSAILFLYKEVLGIDTSSWNGQAQKLKRENTSPPKY